MEIIEGKSRLKQRRASRQTITPEQIIIFFETLVDTCNVVRSAKAAGFSANWAYHRRRFDAAFRNGWAAAVREGYSKLELVLLERAMKGTPKLVRTAKGNDRVMREYSTALAVALLRRHAETAESADYEPDEDELKEVRERILEKLEGLRRRVIEDGTIEVKGLADRIETIRWGLNREAGQARALPKICLHLSPRHPGLDPGTTFFLTSDSKPKSSARCEFDFPRPIPCAE